MTTVSFFGEHRAALGESPLWDGQRQCLWWVDSLAGNIHAAGADAEQRASMSVNQAIGSIGLTAKGLIGALADGFYDIDVESGAATLIAAMPPDRTLRLNDGKADRAGRFLSGQMQIHSSSDTPSPAALWQLADGSAARLVDGLRLTNAICFAPDGATLYFADTLDGIIRAHPYDMVTGAIGQRRDVVDCAAFGSPPDGATVDADGNLWVALVLGQAVVCISPDGRLLHRIDLPMPGLRRRRNGNALCHDDRRFRRPLEERSSRRRPHRRHRRAWGPRAAGGALPGQSHPRISRAARSLDCPARSAA
jgi:L-arabinonolactonase